MARSWEWVMKIYWRRKPLGGVDTIVLTHLLVLVVWTVVSLVLLHHCLVEMTARVAMVAGTLRTGDTMKRILQIDLMKSTLVGVPTSKVLRHQSIAPLFLVNPT